jgi:uncharacterized membrane protein YeaQ/YmgE (transglycosylase-associated protein family)
VLGVPTFAKVESLQNDASRFHDQGERAARSSKFYPGALTSPLHQQPGREDINGWPGYLQNDEAERIFRSGRGMQWKTPARRLGMGFITWIVVGLIAGWLAGQVMKGGGYGVLVDIILGILGGVLGGWVFGLLGIWPGGGIVGAIIVAFIGAVILVGITRLLKRA